MSLLARCEMEGYEVLGKVTVEISKTNREEGVVSLTVLHCIDTQSGSHSLRLSCPLWVYNCTSLPVALRPISEQSFSQADEACACCHMLCCAAMCCEVQ